MWKYTFSCKRLANKSATALRDLINHFQNNTNAIKALDLNIPLHEILLSKILPDHVDEAAWRQREIKVLQMTLIHLKNR